MTTDWHEWYEKYDDPRSTLTQRLGVVRGVLAETLEQTSGPVRLLSLCAGDGRDTLPVVSRFVARSGRAVSGVLVELDPSLAARAGRTASEIGLDGFEVRVADAGTTASYADIGPVDVLMACGVFGNISGEDLVTTVGVLPSLLDTGGHVIWTRGAGDGDVDLADTVRRVFDERGFDEVSVVKPTDATFRVGVARWPGTAGVPDPDQRLFTFFR